MAGAYYGVDAIPKRWLDGLQNRDGIEARALALAQRSSDGLHIPDLIATEHELTRKEGESLEQFMSFARDGGDRGANHVSLSRRTAREPECRRSADSRPSSVVAYGHHGRARHPGRTLSATVNLGVNFKRIRCQ